MSASFARNSVLAATGLALVLVSTSGCGFFRRLAGTDTVDLKNAQVASMSVDLRRAQKTICPREPVQMAVFAKVTLEGDKEAKNVETWQGKAGTNKNDKMEFTDFAFHSEQGIFDHDGWFTPNPNVLATATKELEITSVFKQRPDKFSFNTTYKPDYTCIKQAGKSGSGGQEGHSGQGGQSGQSGSDGAQGGAGSPGGQGANGSDGQPGLHLTAYATMVKTPFYEKLIAVRITGDYEDFVLVPDGQPFTLRAAGGHGGCAGSRRQRRSGRCWRERWPGRQRRRRRLGRARLRQPLPRALEDRARGSRRRSRRAGRSRSRWLGRLGRLGHRPRRQERSARLRRTAGCTRHSRPAWPRWTRVVEGGRGHRPVRRAPQGHRCARPRARRGGDRGRDGRTGRTNREGCKGREGQGGEEVQREGRHQEAEAGEVTA